MKENNPTKNTHMLITGLRLLLVLKMLYEKDMSKSEIIDSLSDNFGLKISKETLKLDINTLIKAGFEITRGNKGNNYRLSLNKEFVLQNLSSEDCNFLYVIKNSSFDLLDYKTIFDLKFFYKKISKFLPEDFKQISEDFKFFNLVNPKVLQKAENAVKNNSLCSVIYDSPERGRIEFETIIKNIVCRHNKLYVDCCSTNNKRFSTLRLDNIKSIKEKKDFQKTTPSKNIKSTDFRIKKQFFENLPLEKFEKVKNVFEKEVEITSKEQDDFFIVQRLISMGKNCTTISDNQIKEKIIKTLKNTLELYI